MMMSRIQKASHPLDQEQANKLAELGEILRQTRLAQSLSLEKVAAQTLIPVRLLTAIEEGRLDRLPEPIYIQAFIRRYADTLGLNGTEYANAFPAHYSLTSAESGRGWGFFPWLQLEFMHLFGLYIVLIVLAVSALSAHLNSSPRFVEDLEHLSSPTASNKIQPPSSPGKPLPAKSHKSQPGGSKVSSGQVSSGQASFGQARPQGVQIKITAKSESWIQVVADGKNLYEGTLTTGTQKSWQANQQFQVVAGNAGGVLVSLNGEPAKPMGELGAVEEATFKAPR
jgi:cytoskeletal protein RodZ